MMETKDSKLDDAVNSALQETDIREIRKRITQCAYRGDSLLGKSLNSAIPSIMSSVVRATLQHAGYDGLSGEDTYTILAYRVLVMAEKFEASLIHEHMQKPSPTIIYPQVRP